MGLGKDTVVYMMSGGRKVGWEDLDKIEEDRVVEVVLMMKGGGKKKNKKARNPWDRSASELEKDETDRSGEDSLGEEARMAVLDDVLNKTKKDGGPMNEIIETMALLGQAEWEKMLKWCVEIMPPEIGTARSWEFLGVRWSGEWRKTKR